MHAQHDTRDELESGAGGWFFNSRGRWALYLVVAICAAALIALLACCTVLWKRNRACGKLTAVKGLAASRMSATAKKQQQRNQGGKVCTSVYALA